MSVQISNLTKIYGEQRAVDDLSFTAGKGEILGFLGPNGAGKSTTMKIATGYLTATYGDVTVCGLNVAEQSLKVRKLIGYLPESNPLYYDMYVREYLQFVGGIYISSGKALRSQVDLMIEKCGLTIEQNKKIGALSKGYKQRVGLAQAFLHDPEVLILDEPTTGLDPNQIVEIRNLIKEFSSDKTVILSTHIMQEVKALCDRVVIIDKGKKTADDAVADITNVQKDVVVLKLEFSGEFDTEIWKDIEGVISTEKVDDQNLKVITSSDKDIRPDIFKLAGEKAMTLVGLTKEESDLESTFRSLTNKD